MAQIINDPNGGINGGANPNGMYTNPNIKFNPIQTIIDGGMCLNSEGKKVGCNSLIKNETVKYAVIKQDAEDKFYEKLGIETQGNRVMSGGGISSKSKGRLLVAVVLVAGYFAYKKFKK